MKLLTNFPIKHTYRRMYFAPEGDPLLLHVPSTCRINVSNTTTKLPSIDNTFNKPTPLTTMLTQIASIPTSDTKTNTSSLTATQTSHIDIPATKPPKVAKQTQTVITSSMIHTPEVKSPVYSNHLIKTHKLTPKIVHPTAIKA